MVIPLPKSKKKLLTLDELEHHVLLASLREVVDVLHDERVVKSLVNRALSVELLLQRHVIDFSGHLLQFL